MKYAKKIGSIIIALLLFVTSINGANAQYSDYNLEIESNVAYGTVLAGEKNYLNVNLKSTGSKTTFTDVKIEISASESNFILFNEEELKAVLDAHFDSFTIENGKIVIQTEVLESGRYLELPIYFTTRNGVIPHQSEIDFEVRFTSNELDKAPIKTNAMVVESSNPLKINNAFTGSSVGGVSSPGMQWYGEGYFRSKSIIDYKKIGQGYILEGSKIKIVETYHENLQYARMQTGPEPVVDTVNRTLTWYFDAPSYATQDESVEALWTQELEVVYGTAGAPDLSVNKGVKSGITVVSELSFTDVSGVLNVDESRTSITLYPPKSDIPTLVGSWNVFGHWGPTDGNGNYGHTGTGDMNMQPTVYPGDTLTFGHRVSAMYNGQYSGYDKYLFNYLIDDYLDLRTLRVPLQWVDYPNTIIGLSPLERAPEYDIYLLNEKPELDIQGTNELDASSIIAVLRFGVDFEHGDEIDIAQVLLDRGLPADTHISQVRYDFTYAPGGLFTYSNSGLADSFFRYTFKIHDNWQDSSKYDAANNLTTLRNEITIYGKETLKPGFNYDQFDIQIWDFTNDVITGKKVCNPNQVPGTSYWTDENRVRLSCTNMNRRRNNTSAITYGSHGNSDFWTINGDRWAYVTSVKDERVPTTANTIDVKDSKDGEILPGKNTVIASVKNVEDISLGQINRGGLTSYLYIPDVITLDLQDIKFYSSDLSQLTAEIKETSITQGNFKVYEVTWDSHGVEIEPGATLTIEIGAQITGRLSEITLHILTHLPNNDDFSVLSTSQPKITDTIKVNDTNDLTGQGTDTVLMQSSNAYKVIGDYYILTDKSVKGALDSKYTKLGNTTLDGIVSYRLNITNKEGVAIRNMILMDVLPSVNDLGITDSVTRGSDFTLVLNGPVKVDDRFTVLYSKSKNPKRDVLNDVLSKDNFDAITNPGNSEDANWLTEDLVDDFNTIHSFIIVLKGDADISIDEEFSVEFTTIIDPKEATSLADIETDKVAWNSFAYTVNGKPAVEPHQVGVVLGSLTDTPEKPTEPEKPTNPEKPKDPSLPNTGAESMLMYAAVSIVLGSVIYTRTKKKEEE